MKLSELRQLAENDAKKNFVSHIPGEEIGARLFETGHSFNACRTAAQQQGYRKEAERSRTLLRRMWEAEDEGRY
jgi:hypothetical protein